MSSKVIICILVILFVAVPAGAAEHKHPEKWYQQKWCEAHGGQTEVRLSDGTRADCLTDEYAIEFDFGPKWAEAIGQSLYYGLQTGKKPGVVLILEDEGDYRYWIRLNTILEQYRLPIKAWQMG